MHPGTATMIAADPCPLATTQLYQGWGRPASAGTVVGHVTVAVRSRAPHQASLPRPRTPRPASRTCRTPGCPIGWRPADGPHRAPRRRSSTGLLADARPRPFRQEWAGQSRSLFRSTPLRHPHRSPAGHRLGEPQGRPWQRWPQGPRPLPPQRSRGAVAAGSTLDHRPAGSSRPPTAEAPATARI